MALYRVYTLFVISVLFSHSFATVSLQTNGLAATVSNGAVTISFRANAMVSSVKINNINIAATRSRSFYLDWNGNEQDYFIPATITVVEHNGSMAHFYWTQPGSPGKFYIELHYIMVDGINGIYSWAKLKNDQNEVVYVEEIRTVYRFDPNVLTKATNGVQNGSLYTYAYLHGQTAVQDETWQLPDGTYYTKYDFGGYIRETPYHGVFGNGYGAFVISASREYHGGSALKQDLLVHQDSLVANYFVSGHFGTQGLSAPSGWSHIYGPWLVYFATGSDNNIISDVVNRVRIEQNSWPYSFVGDAEYPMSRGSISGTVTGQRKATIVLYDSNEEPDVQALGYLYTTETNSDGSFNISKVRPGTYTVLAYPVAGQGSENTAKTSVTVTADRNTEVKPLNLPEPENVIWAIGEVNRKSDPYTYLPTARNYIYQTVPTEQLTFVIESSDPSNVWYYAQSKPGRWTIQYEDTQDGVGRTLRVALAAASRNPHLIVTLNGYKIGDARFEDDQSIYRSALQSGNFYANVFTVDQSQVVSGTNSLTLQVSTGQVMYDAISLQRG